MSASMWAEERTRLVEVIPQIVEEASVTGECKQL